MQRWNVRLVLLVVLSLTLGFLGLVPWLMRTYASPAPTVIPKETSSAVQSTNVVTGAYTGHVIVAQPVPLGAAALGLAVRDKDGALSGAVDGEQTMVFVGSPALSGKVTANANLTPTFRIDSVAFSGVISGRSVQRKFSLTGEAAEDGDVLQGQYVETISGFTPQPMTVNGTFLLTRLARVQAVALPPSDVTLPGPHGTAQVHIYLPFAVTGKGKAQAATAAAEKPAASGLHLYLPAIAK